MGIKKDHFAGGRNITGEGADDLATLLKDRAEKSQFASLAALPANAPLADVITRLNAITAALKLGS